MQGCTRPRIDLPVEKPIAVAVKVEDQPPAELLRCADRSHGLTADSAAWAVLPKQKRTELIAFARAHRADADQLDRLVNWVAPGTCAKPSAAP